MTNKADILDAIAVGAGWAGLGVALLIAASGARIGYGFRDFWLR